jgi:hypothetical protein
LNFDHLVLPEEFRRSCNVEVGVDAAHRPVDGVGDDERADDGQIEFVVANYALNIIKNVQENVKKYNNNNVKLS